MAAIGGITVDIMRGRPSGLRKRVEVWEVLGLDGTGVMTQGRGNRGTELLLIRFGTRATVTAWFTAVEALQGTIVTVVDDLGDSHTNMLVQEMGEPRFSAAHLAYGIVDAIRGERRVAVLKRQ
jgi:hypothetical protein